MSIGELDEDQQRLTPRRLRQVLPRVLPQVTEYLAAALSGEAQSEPVWNVVQWRIARAVAVIHGISPLLSTRLTWVGPPGWRAFLDSQRGHTATRFHRMAALLNAVDVQAARAGIAFMPLKGAALHGIGVYAPGERPMADIDLLVKREDLLAMNRVLVELGYRTVSASEHEHVLVPVGGPSASLTEHADNGITIELHACIRWPMPVRPVDITSTLWASASNPGRNDYPSLGSLMGHLLLHAAVNMQLRILRMIQLHDMALLAPRLSATDWSAMLAPEGGRAAPWWALPPLQLLGHYYPGVIPGDAIAAIKSGCPALLRFTAPRLRLTNVSVSNPRRAMFPALLWAGSLPEACTTLGGRLRSAVQAVRSNAPVREATELQPWIARSHRRRAFDVLLGRARPETMMVITAALRDDPSFGAGYEQPKVA
jgi:hypothetical protein